MLKETQRSTRQHCYNKKAAVRLKQTADHQNGGKTMQKKQLKI